MNLAENRYYRIPDAT